MQEPNGLQLLINDARQPAVYYYYYYYYYYYNRQYMAFDLICSLSYVRVILDRHEQESKLEGQLLTQTIQPFKFKIIQFNCYEDEINRQTCLSHYFISIHIMCFSFLRLFSEYLNAMQSRKSFSTINQHVLTVQSISHGLSVIHTLTKPLTGPYPVSSQSRPHSRPFM